MADRSGTLAPPSGKVIQCLATDSTSSRLTCPELVANSPRGAGRAPTRARFLAIGLPSEQLAGSRFVLSVEEVGAATASVESDVDELRPFARDVEIRRPPNANVTLFAQVRATTEREIEEPKESLNG